MKEFKVAIIQHNVSQPDKEANTERRFMSAILMIYVLVS